MANITHHTVIFMALMLVACPDSEGSTQTSATETSTSTETDPDGPLPSPEDTDTSASAESTATASSTSGSTTEVTTTGSDGLCGDGVIDMGEECDNGDENNEEGLCTPDCTLACGDGELQGDEECDLGPMNNNKGTCTKACADARCGDGYIQPGEDCDDGDVQNSLDPGQCHPITCTKNIPTCGNNKVDDGEECDKSAPGPDSNSCTGSCTFISRVVFVSPEVYSSDFGDLDLGGLETADQLCRALSEEANLDHAEKFIALLSTPEQPIAERIGDFGGEYADTNATRVALGSQGLLSGALDAAITKDQFGQNAMAMNTFAWTGSTASGASSPDSCSSWVSTSWKVFGAIGELGSIDGSWLSDDKLSCSYDAHIYCIQNGESE